LILNVSELKIYFKGFDGLTFSIPHETTNQNKGGIRQRLSAVHEAASNAAAASSSAPSAITTRRSRDSDEQCDLDKFFYDLYKKGKISSIDLQRGSAAAARNLHDSSAHRFGDTLLQWARLGTSGDNPGNVSRDLLRLMEKKTKMPRLYMFKCPSWDATGNRPKEAWLAMLLPHEMLHVMVGDSDLSDWVGFDAAHDVQSLNLHLRKWCDAVQATGGTDDIISIAMWGDAAPYNTRDSLYLFLWSTLSGTMSRSRFWATAFPKVPSPSLPS